jgi:hypothetical protein
LTSLHERILRVRNAPADAVGAFDPYGIRMGNFPGF